MSAPVLVYHESARIIVFRDHLRRAVKKKKKGDGAEDARSNTAADVEELDIQTKLAEADVEEEFLAPLPPKKKSPGKSKGKLNRRGSHEDDFPAELALTTSKAEEMNSQESMGHVDAILDSTEITLATKEQQQPHMEPLPDLQYGPEDEFSLLLQEPDEQVPNAFTLEETHVLELFEQQQCAVKTIKNSEWTAFLKRFRKSEKQNRRMLPQHCDIPPDGEHPFNSFLTSTSVLPTGGRKMRCFGSTTQYTVGVVFELPVFNTLEEEDNHVKASHTWAWPSGYSAKTEFNIDNRGKLINGRKEALISLATLRQYNTDYLTKDSYIIGTRTVSALTSVPYNEVYLRVGGVGRTEANDSSTANESAPAKLDRSLERGVGIPVALFVRTAKYGDLITLLRTRARLGHTWGEYMVAHIPLLYITPEKGVSVLTDSMQKQLWKTAASNLNPFQNSVISWKTTLEHTEEESFQQKVDELLDLDSSIQSILTPEELAHIAGGFGATDESVARIFKRAMMQDRKENARAGDGKSHKLQDIVNEGLASSIRSGDYHTSRQLLILYSLVSSLQVEGEESSNDGNDEKKTEARGEGLCRRDERLNVFKSPGSLGRDAQLMKRELQSIRKGGDLTHLTSPPPPPPLDTDRLRSATNSDGLLAVLGAAQVLRSMQDGSAKRRVEEAVHAVEEWVDYGEQSVAFRISSWYDQRAAQDDLEIATERNSSFMAFVSNKAVTNRKAFAKQLRDSIYMTDFTDHRFLDAIKAMVDRMHAPCLRLELLQYVLGLDNRYSVAHVARSVELATACLDVAASTV